jgi:hypothetical protein
VPETLTDSDTLEGATNVKGWVFYGARQLWKNTDFAFTVYSSEMKDGAGPKFHNRIRGQWDIKVKF